MQERQITLLLIEDQKFSTDLFTKTFNQYNILVAHSGETGIKIYQEQRPDMVFLDIGLLDISGFEVLERLRKFDPNAYIVMLSGMNNELYIKKCKELGAIGFLTKPYQKDYIQYYIDKFKEAHAAKDRPKVNINSQSDF